MGFDRSRNSSEKARALVASCVVLLGLVVAGFAIQSTAHAATGDHFSFAPASDVDTGSTAPAFTDALAVPAGPDVRTWWAGVCDLHAGAPAVGAPPADRRFAACIEQPTYVCPPATVCSPEPALIAPLAPGVTPGSTGPDGWINQAGGASLPGPTWRLRDITQAGAHPDGSASFWFSRSPESPKGLGTANGHTTGPDGQPRNIRVSLPPGVVGNPNAVPKCPSEAVVNSPVSCHPKTQIGVSSVQLGSYVAAYPVYNVEPRDGKTAELIISGVGLSQVYDGNAPVVANARTDGDFGIDAGVSWIPSAAAIHSQTFTIWGVPWAKSHDIFRPISGYCGAQNLGADSASSAHGAGTAAMHLTGLTGGFADGCSQRGVSYDPSWGSIKPFLTTQTECSPTHPVTRIFADNWHTTVTATEDSVVPLLTDCADIQFDASFALDPTSTAAESASGLNVTLNVPQNNEPPFAKRFNPDDDDPTSAVAHWKTTAGLARSHLKDSVVTLPPGFSVNPSSATGLRGCSDAEIGVTNPNSNPLVFNNGDPFNKDGGADGAECPDSSKIGTADVSVPLLEAGERLTGEVVLGEAKSTDPQSGRMLRLFIVVRNRERGLIAKIHGTTKANGVVGEGGNGQLVTTFENNPRAPFDELKLSFKDGPKGILATPQRCGSNAWTSTFSPWSGGPAVPQGGQLPVGSNCGYGFGPSLQAGMDTRAPRAHGDFSFRFSRGDGQQWFNGLRATLPTGLLASVKGLIGPGLCSNAQAAAGACPASSRIGTVDAKAGAGDPFVLEEKGEVFLTEGYKGGEYGLAVKVRTIAGPFRGAMELTPVIVRQAIHVDRETAQVTAISDEFPKVWHGVPLRVREVTVNVDRDRFMLNPSNCGVKQVGATITSVEGVNAALADSFQAANCRSLPFEPRLGLRLTGRKQMRTGKHPGVRALVRQEGIGEAGIRRAEVRLPKSLALDVDNAQALCEFEDGTRLDPENHCPKGSIVGRARAQSPLLNKPLAGNVFFVKNVRRSASGNLIRTLPMLIVALRGEIAINLKGESDVKRGKLVNTFAGVPDAPVSQFNMNIKGGKNGILAVTRTRRGLINLCSKPRSHVAEADMDGQNGRRHDFDVRMKVACAKKSKAACKTRKQKASKRCKAQAKRNKAVKRRAAG